MGNEEIIYGVGNGDSYREHVGPGAGTPAVTEEFEEAGLYRETLPFKIKTFWANSLVVSSFEGGRGVNVRVRRHDQDTGEVVDDEVITVELSRDGINRLINGLRKHRKKMFGEDA